MNHVVGTELLEVPDLPKISTMFDYLVAKLKRRKYANARFRFRVRFREFTLYGRPFYIQAEGTIAFRDFESYYRNAWGTADQLGLMLQDDLSRNYAKNMEGHFWILDKADADGAARPTLYRAARETMSVEEVDYRRKGLGACNGSGRGIPWGSLTYESYDVCSGTQWIKEGERMLCAEDRKWVEENFDYLRRLEDLNIALQADLRNKVAEKRYENSQADFIATATADGVHFRWTIKKPGKLKVFKRGDCFSDDKFDESRAGALLVDDYHEQGDSMDYALEKGRDYFYTVNFHLRERDGSHSQYNIARFSMRLVRESPAKDKVEAEFEEKARRLELVLKARLNETIAKLRYDMERKRLSRKVVDEEFGKWEREILKGRSADELSGEERASWEDLQDLKEHFFERL